MTVTSRSDLFAPPDRAVRTSTKSRPPLNCALTSEASSLSPDVKERLVGLAGTRMTSDGVLLIDSRTHRTQAQNREAARERLIALIEKAMVRPRARRATKPRAGARETRLASKKLRGTVKNLRGRAGVDDD